MEDLVVVLQSYISVVTLVICACVGYAVKNLITNQEINRFIPIIVMVLGIIINIWTVGYPSPEVIAQGAVSGLASSGAYEAIDQLRQRSYEKKLDGFATDPSELTEAEPDGE